MAKINVKTCELKLDKGEYKIYLITDTEGKKYDSMGEAFTEGEHDVDITPNDNPAYNAKIKKVKAATAKTGFPQKDYKFEKRKTALEITMQIVSGKDAASDDVLKVAEKIEQWLNR